MPRLSGTNDILPVTISERILPKDMAIGAPIHALGQFRSYNKIVDDRSRLMLTVFIRELLQEPAGANLNVITLAGYICKKRHCLAVSIRLLLLVVAALDPSGDNDSVAYL